MPSPDASEAGTAIFAVRQAALRYESEGRTAEARATRLRTEADAGATPGGDVYDTYELGYADADASTCKSTAAMLNALAKAMEVDRV